MREDRKLTGRMPDEIGTEVRYLNLPRARLERPLVLVFDNCQEVPTEAPLCELLPVALDEAPAGVGFVVITRGLLPLARR